tara:strand:+ start:5734 stop:6210 length:477 start_codon:yes stop_codon:yes gene_type:complete
MATIATLYKSGEVEGNSAYVQHPGGMFVRKTVFSSPVFVVNDVVQLVDVFAGETLHSIVIKSTDIDTNGSPAIVLDVGYGNSTTETASTSDDIIDGSTIGQGSGVAIASALDADSDGGTAFAAGPLEFTATDTIDLHVQTAPATGATGTITFFAYFSK